MSLPRAQAGLSVFKGSWSSWKPARWASHEDFAYPRPHWKGDPGALYARFSPGLFPGLTLPGMGMVAVCYDGPELGVWQRLPVFISWPHLFQLGDTLVSAVGIWGSSCRCASRKQCSTGAVLVWPVAGAVELPQESDF